MKLRHWALFAVTLNAQPPLQYPVKAKTADLLRSTEAFRPLATQIRADLEPLLRQKSDDNAARRELLSTVMMLDLLDGRTAAARQRMDEIQALEPTPAAKALSNLTTRAILDSQTGSTALSASITRTLDALPFETTQSEIRALKARLDLPVNESQLITQLSATLDPIIEKTSALPASVVHGLPALRFSLIHELPARAALSEALGAYIRAHQR